MGHNSKIYHNVLNHFLNLFYRKISKLSIEIHILISQYDKLNIYIFFAIFVEY